MIAVLKLKVNDIISKDQDIDNVFNDFFVNIPSKVKEPIKPNYFKTVLNHK